MSWPSKDAFGLVSRDAARSFGGYTLLTSVRGTHATLLDPQGRPVHRWEADEGLQYAYLLDSGNLLARTLPPEDAGGVEQIGGSSAAIVELDWESEEIVWSFKAETILDFFSFMVGGAERLPNGNTFVTAGASGHLFEITPEGDVVWDYLSPYCFDSPFGPTPAVFRAHRYAEDARCLTGRDLSRVIDSL